MMAWIMKSRRVRGDDAGVHFYIGAVVVAKIVFAGGGMNCMLRMEGCETKFYPGVFEAMSAMHEALNSPSPEDAT